eukprot:1794361-Prorocentrum_lima.AAC.1
MQILQEEYHRQADMLDAKPPTSVELPRAAPEMQKDGAESCRSLRGQAANVCLTPGVDGCLS